jgi:uncharacterized protein (DUF58 family)
MNTALKTLQLKARHQVYTLLSGHHLSALSGEGYDFSALREYQVGDDIRKINWMVSAKHSNPYIKELHVNRELSVVVAAFMDGSLYFGKGNAKQKKLTEVASILGYACEQQRDLFTGFCYTQDTCTYTPPSKNIHAIHQFSKNLFEIPLLHTSIDHNTSIRNLFNRVQTPSLIFILGDFLEEVDLSILAQKHEIIAIIIRDTEEEAPKVLGDVTLTSPKIKGLVKTYFGKRVRNQYLSRLQQNDAKLVKYFSTHNIRYVKICTNDEAVQKLLTLFI